MNTNKQFKPNYRLCRSYLEEDAEDGGGVLGVVLEEDVPLGGAGGAEVQGEIAPSQVGSRGPARRALALARAFVFVFIVVVTVVVVIFIVIGVLVVVKIIVIIIRKEVYILHH